MQTSEVDIFHRVSLAETINITDVHGDGNLTVNAGSGSTVIITTCPHHVHVPGEEHSCTHCKALVLPKSVSKPKSLSTKTEKTCHMYIDNLAMLTVEGKILKCRGIIAKLMKTKTDPDSQVSLRHAASLNAIYEGDFKKVNRLLHEVQAILPETMNETEHRLWWGNLKCLAKMREGNCDAGIVFAKEALPLLDMMAPSCITAWLLINHALILTEIAATQDDREDRQFFMKMAEKDFQHAIEHTEYEHPKQMLHSQSRVPRFAKMGLAFLYLGCKESADNFRLGTSDVSLDDIKRAKNVIDALDRDGMVCDSGQFQFMVAKTCLHYRLGSYQQAYEQAQEAKVFATKHSFGGFVKFADSIVQYLQDYK
ncbi:PREDICTED: uncharacterized protein LOC109477255 [Branchiostoma belcheri]|uniref:Uncharacterized protein LOC109477255 n=1 Tax=Branchiostoma belcheri TaxID=7741 RepID=A0A6P4ZSG6_BRABE|nr:PREDICTED: uncharacterized protein LOC109477255 [Branchiostoma belcheri]